jgi:hypothetical protein
MTLTVACVLKSGGIYDATWVERLRAGVARHLPVEHRFVCLSDVDVPCERIPLEHDWPGWWAKVELFKLPGPALYFDLDTAIVGDLSDIAHEAIDPMNRLTMLQDFYRADGLGSGVMAWGNNIQVPKFYERFAQDSVGWMRKIGGRGDQGFIESCEHYGFGPRQWQSRLPGQIVSYKVHCRGGQSPVTGGYTPPGIPEGARVVCLHGLPKFADMPPNDPVRVAWERAA